MKCPHCRTIIGAEDCLLCGSAGELQNLETIRNFALVNRLITLYPQIRDQGPDVFLQALNMTDGTGDAEAVKRLARLVVCAVAVTANLVRQTIPLPQNGEHIYALRGERMTHANPAQWTVGRVLVAALNGDGAMTADLMVAALGDCCVTEAVERLVDLLFWTIATAVDAARFATRGHVGTP